MTTPGTVVDPAWLRAALDQAEPPADSYQYPLTILDVRWRLGAPSARPDHLSGHVPGAVFVELSDDLTGHGPTGGRHPLPDPARLQAVLRAAGVRADSTVVVYDDGDGLPAARAWWTLRWAGHDRVAVLDGGYRAWLAAGGPVETAVPEPTPGDVTVRPGQLPTLDAGSAAALPATGVLLDVRAAERYRGEREPVDPVAGHIPGAVNVPKTDTVGPDGRLLDPARLRELFAAAGVREDVPVGAYCGSGVTAAHTALALTVAGFRPALYVGSWSDWISDPTRPIATGETP
ncbi:sulfurtransferase [Actinocatenispora comari]|uniref:Sulfurtransferase n=1 Tax=Actinocatenispora comari TaxID=2807577 RepID=A0A8J4ENG2_9ACTN|nr:sulfurtransferase [Actinocatenispora comari]GIL31432.1 sulfurtransferase [Actinocatenispora comari]